MSTSNNRRTVGPASLCRLNVRRCWVAMVVGGGKGYTVLHVTATDMLGKSPHFTLPAVAYQRRPVPPSLGVALACWLARSPCSPYLFSLDSTLNQEAMYSLDTTSHRHLMLLYQSFVCSYFQLKSCVGVVLSTHSCMCCACV